MTGAEVKAWREARRLSQAQLARLLPMTLATLQGWERTVPRGAPPPFMRRALHDLENELIASSDTPKQVIAALGGGVRAADGDGEPVDLHIDERFDMSIPHLPALRPLMRGVNADLDAIDRTARAIFDDVEDSEAHELAYEPVED